MFNAQMGKALLSFSLLCGPVLAAAQPAPAPPAAATEQSTPKGALKFFTEAIRAADEQKMRSTLHAITPLENRMADATMKVAAALSRLRLAAVSKYGEAGGATFQSSVPTEEDVKRIESATEKVDGDTAVVELGGAAAGTTPAPAAQMKMVKVDGAWKISVAHMVGGQPPAKLEQDLKTMETTVRVVNETTEEIKAGKHPTDKAAYDALKSKMLAAFPQKK